MPGAYRGRESLTFKCDIELALHPICLADRDCLDGSAMINMPSHLDLLCKQAPTGGPAGLGASARRPAIRQALGAASAVVVGNTFFVCSSLRGTSNFNPITL